MGSSTAVSTMATASPPAPPQAERSPPTGGGGPWAPSTQPRLCMGPVSNINAGTVSARQPSRSPIQKAPNQSGPADRGMGASQISEPTSMAVPSVPGTPKPSTSQRTRWATSARPRPSGVRRPNSRHDSQGTTICGRACTSASGMRFPKKWCATTPAA